MELRETTMLNRFLIAALRLLTHSRRDEGEEMLRIYAHDPIPVMSFALEGKLVGP